MVKFLVIGVCLFVVYKLFANDFIHKNEKNSAKEQKSQEKKVAAGELVKDPICGTYVSVDDSVTVRDGATVIHFCSYDCRDAYLKQLEQGGRELPDNIKGNSDDE
ncbi:transcriptional regulator [Desulfovibrio sp. OttesenSCG-928-F07]|nr:transcriptional regulator [Desulfovibrio sp. OttesenSCG-928-F07]